MPLKTLVKVGNISNLSDARYCSGMGVDMLGFSVIEGQKGFINPKSFQEIRGWISGPSIVAEIYGIKSEFELGSIIENYSPDFLELSIEEWINLPAAQTFPLILSVNRQSFLKHQNNIISKKNKIAHLLVRESESTEFINKVSETFSVLMEIESKIDVASILENLPLKGITLNGSQELKPGLKDYDNLSEILEKLEVE